MVYELVTSKKFIVSVGAIVSSVTALVAAKCKFAIDPDTADTVTKIICGMAATYVGATGLADFGKSKTKLEVAALQDAAPVVAQVLAPDPPK